MSGRPDAARGSGTAGGGAGARPGVLRGAGVALAFWTAFSAAHVALNEVARLTAPEPYARRTWLLAIVVTAGWFWAAATPLVLRLAERLAPARVGLARSLAGHAGAALALALANAGVRHLVRHALAPDAPASLALVAAVNLDANLIAYVTLVGVGRALALHRDYTERAAHLLVLHSQLSRARLQFLQRQLRPHFLFNALNAVAELAREAPAAAERALGQLQRLLRSALASEGEPEVTLRDELAALAPFVEIQRMRFGDALAVEYDVDPGVLDALVPSLVLQPLVENAVRHGLATAGARGLVRVVGWRADGRLHLVVRDNGSGGGGRLGHARRPGIGLANTRGRLTQLHGDAATLTLRPAAAGGTEAALELPLRRPGDPPTPPVPPGRARASAPDGDLGAVASTATLEVPAILPTTREMERALTTTGAWIAPGLEDHAQPSWRTLGGFALLWVTVGLFWMGQAALVQLARSGEVQRWTYGSADFVSALVWAALTPLVLRAARRWRVGRDGWMRPALVHAALALVVDVAHITVVMQLALPEREGRLLHPGNVSQLTLNVLIYATLLAWSQGRDFAAWYRERGLAAARLEAALPLAQWRALAVALRPQFLLGVLARAAALVRTDAERAETVIERLADFLRAVLDASTLPRRTVREELGVLEATLALHHATTDAPVRFACRIAPEALDRPAPEGVFPAIADGLMVLDEEAAATGRPARRVRLALRTTGAGAEGALRVRAEPELLVVGIPGARHLGRSAAVVPLPMPPVPPISGAGAGPPVTGTPGPAGPVLRDRTPVDGVRAVEIPRGAPPRGGAAASAVASATAPAVPGVHPAPARGETTPCRSAS